MGAQWSLARFAIGLALSATATTGFAQFADHPVLRNGNGIDHATLLTRSLVRTSKTFGDLGFTVSPIGSYDNGFENSTMWFADGTYLELFGVHDAQEVAKGSESHAAVGPEGLTWVTLDTSSIDDTFNYLKAKGHSLFGPETLPDPTAWSYKLAGLEKDTLPGRRIYFIQYNHDRIAASRQAKLESWRFKESHRNSAQGLEAVWVAVRSLADAEKLYRDSGFVLGKHVKLPHLKAIGREVVTKERALLLIEPEIDSPVAKLLGSSPAVFVGYSIRVSDLARAKSVVTENKKLSLSEYVGPYGQSLLVSPDKAGGSWLEFFE